MDIREPVVAALEAVGETGVVDPEKMQGSGIEIVNVDRVFHNIVTEVVRLTVNVPPPSPLHPPSRRYSSGGDGPDRDCPL